VAKLHIFGPIYPNLAKLHIFATNVSNRSRQFHFKIISGAIVYIVGDPHPAKKLQIEEQKLFWQVNKFNCGTCSAAKTWHHRQWHLLNNRIWHHSQQSNWHQRYELNKIDITG
jgi:hypothetical protein